MFDAAREDLLPIETPSLQSLHVTLRTNGQTLATATGFIVETESAPLLITNRHVVRGRHQDNDSVLHPSAGIPDDIEITYIENTHPLTWGKRVERLLGDDGVPRWIEHPSWRERADVVALPLTQVSDVFRSPYSLEKPEREIAFRPTDIVSVVGFPYGHSTMGTAIWATGFVASEPGLPFNRLPVFLIDCRTRTGQSGSPVIFHRPSGGVVALANGEMFTTKEPITQLLGVYSSRVNSESDLGYVWKINVVRELAAHAAERLREREETSGIIE